MPSPAPTAPTDDTDSVPTDGVGIRPLGFGDLPQVIAIERRAFPTPWSPAMFALELAKASTIALGAFLPDRRKSRSLAGYMIASRYADVWHLMNVAVDPPVRRHGMASAMLEELIAQINPADPITLEVRPSNRPAIALYESFGFRANGLRRGYYRDTGEDALIMWRGSEATHAQGKGP
jgi:ribosomal-protein-alanine N-acetyltransferase